VTLHQILNTSGKPYHSKILKSLSFSFEFNHILLSLSFANITLCIDFCKKVNEKAANDCSLAAV